MPRLVSTLLFATFWVLLVQPISAENKTHNSAADRSVAGSRLGTLLAHNGEFLTVRLDGKTRRIPVTDILDFELDGSILRLELTDERVVRLQSKTQARLNAKSRKNLPQRRSSGISTRTKRKPALQQAVSDVRKMRAWYRDGLSKHERRMHKWLSQLENAKRDGVTSPLLSNQNLQHTRQMSDALETKVNEQLRLLGQIETIAHQVASHGGFKDAKSYGRLTNSIQLFKERHVEVVRLENDLEGNLAANYNALISQ